LGVGSALPLVLQRTASALARRALETEDAPHRERILVVIELSGGNDGLNTVVPHADDAYYRARPTLGIPRQELILLDDHFGFHPSLQGFEELYKDGRMAIVHGCGYPQPNLSHFVSMSYWHTGAPNSGDQLGWLGRVADELEPEPTPNVIVNISGAQSLAVRSRRHAPLVFDNPERFRRKASPEQAAVWEKLSRAGAGGPTGLDFARQMAAHAASGSAFVREACARYRTPVDYGLAGGLAENLRKVAALIDAGLPARIYYVSYAGNAFDTHVFQADLHARLLMYTADAVRGFVRDLARLGWLDDVAVMMFTEFGRRVEENASQGTDHGTATPMFVLGGGVRGGFYGEPPSLTDLDDGNLKMTTDFRRVYATMIHPWMELPPSEALLKGDFPPLDGMFV